jgi:hypothetical protein
VRFGVSLEDDLIRRDFTVNAMAWDGERLTDLFGGQEDLRQRCIRTVGDPVRRFTEDGLRIARALRFACTLNFALDPAVLDAALQCRDRLQAVSLPRLRTELQSTVLGNAPQAADGFLTGGGLAWLGLCPPTEENAPAFTLAPLAQVPCRMLLRWWGRRAACFTSPMPLIFRDSF